MASGTNPTKRKGAGIAFVLPGQGAGAPTPSVPKGEGAVGESAGGRPVPRTGVGLLTATVFETQKLESRIEGLQQQVAQLSAERGSQWMDARAIVPSRWANRHPDAFAGPAFEQFKREIQDAGGNVQPIKVRPLEARRGDGGTTARYEIVFGHRRHRACLELGLPVQAVVQEVDDPGLFVQMERENRGREALSAWEQGRMYLRAIDERLFASNSRLAAAIGRGVSDIGKAMRIARLPQEVTSAFASPNDIQFRWATNLERALLKHHEAVLAAARELHRTDPRPPALTVFQRLTACLHPPGVRPSHPAPPLERRLALGEGRAGVVRLAEGGRTTIELDAGLLPPQNWDALEAALKTLV
jgi:ParB family transcriptional regulator, chromosome partitioning protein